MLVPRTFKSFPRRAIQILSDRVVIKRRLPERFGGLSLYVSPRSALSYWRPALETIEPSLLSFAAESVRHGHTVWDVGANLGLFTFAAAGLAGQNGNILAIEPDTWLISLLRRSAGLAASSRLAAPVDILALAVSDNVGVEQFHIARRGRSSNHLHGSTGSLAGGSTEIQTVMTVTLDWLLERFPPPDVLKIDVLGAEKRVLLGSQKLLSTVRPVILCEVVDNAPDVTAIFHDNGYELFDMNKHPQDRQPLAQASYFTLAKPK